MKTKKKTIKLRIIDWWQDDNKANFDANPFIKLLRQKYEVVYSDAPDFILCGPFGNKHFDYDCVKIFYTGENTRIDWNLYDYGIGFDYMDFGDKYLRMPLFYIYDCVNECRNLNKRDKFCSYLVRHSGAFLWEKSGGFRDRFFDKLSEYKCVDSGGGWRNNIGGTIDELYGKNTKNMFAVKRKWLENYKFNICFENSSYPGYLTEKLIDAYNAGCIPIYWGDTSLRICENPPKTQTGGGNRYNPNDLDSIDMRIPHISPYLLEYKINPKAFINAHNFPNLDALVEEVKRIDNDENAYNAMRNEPLFLDNFNPKAFYEKKVLDFFDNIFSQNPSEAFRRGDDNYMRESMRIIKKERLHSNILNELNQTTKQLNNLRNIVGKYEHLSKDALNIAEFCNHIQQSTRTIRNNLKFWRKK